jgi:hypothetical protein
LSPYLRFPHQNPVHTSPLLHTRYMPRPSHSSWFYHPHNFWWGVQIIIIWWGVQIIIISTVVALHSQRKYRFL